MPHKIYSLVDLARLGWFEQIKWSELKAKDITSFDRNGMTFLHYTAQHGRWQSLPLPLRDKKYWKDAKDGSSIYLCAFKGTDHSWIDKDDLTEDQILKKDKQGESIVSILVNKGQLYRLPRNSITTKVLRDKYQQADLKTQKSYESCLIHLIARKDQIKCVPSHLLTEANLSIQGHYGESVYHILAERSQIHLLPKETLTKRSLTLKNAYGATPLVSLAENQPELIPKEFINPDLFYRDYDAAKQETPLQAWAAGRGWQEIPKSLLTKESISIGSPESPIDHILQNYAQETKGVSVIDKILVSKIVDLLKLVETKELQRLKRQEEERESMRFIEAPLLAYTPANLIKKEIAKRSILEKVTKKECEISL